MTVTTDLQQIFRNERKYRPTYDFQLADALRKIDGVNGYRDLGVMMKDDLRRLNGLPSKCFCIVNYDNRHQDGSHWVAVVKDGQSVYHFGSYGIPPIQEIIDRFKNPHTDRMFYNDTAVQLTGTNICGHLCLWFIHAIVAHRSSFRQALDKMEALSNRKA